MRAIRMSGSMSGVWKRSQVRTSKAPPDERGGNRYARATATAPHLDSTPLIEANKGGVGGGGARLTSMRREVLSLYRAMEDHATAAVMSDMEKLRALMVAEPPED